MLLLVDGRGGAGRGLKGTRSEALKERREDGKGGGGRERLERGGLTSHPRLAGCWLAAGLLAAGWLARWLGVRSLPPLAAVAAGLLGNITGNENQAAPLPPPLPPRRLPRPSPSHPLPLRGWEPC